MRLTLVLSVAGCPVCGGDHEKVCFSPTPGPSSEQTHRGVCPATDQEFWMDTQSVSGVWDRLLEASGVKL